MASYPIQRYQRYVVINNPVQILQRMKVSLKVKEKPDTISGFYFPLIFFPFSQHCMGVV